MLLSHANVLITGGSRGIGKEAARLLVAGGAGVVINGRDEAVLAATADEISCKAIAGDVALAADVERMVAGTIEALEGFNVLINNAAIGSFAPLVDTDPADLERVWRVNVLGAFLVAQAAARHFIANGGGTIINVGSTAARKGFAGGTVYASSKFALSGFTECWRAELRQHDVRVMQINPSEVQTGFGRSQRPHSESKLQAPDIAQVMVDMLAMPDRGFVTETTVWATNPQ